MQRIDLDTISTLPLFQGMQHEAFEELMHGAYHQQFPPGVVLIEEGCKADFMHVVTEGAVELYAGWNHHETTLEIVTPPSTFILAACIHDAPCLMSARTLCPSRIVLIPASNLRAAFSLDADFARAVVMELATCYRRVIRHAKDIKLRTSKERLSAFLIGQIELSQGPVSFELPFEKRVLASCLGMTPENLSRALRQLRKDGVSVSGRTVHVSDVDKLRSIAKPSLLIDNQT